MIATFFHGNYLDLVKFDSERIRNLWMFERDPHPSGRQRKRERRLLQPAPGGSGGQGGVVWST